MGGRFFNPRARHSSSTAAYSGGKLYFYAAGTSTPLDTYSDYALATPNANPVVLNSAGYPDSSIFLSDAGYKVVLKDSSDNTIWTEDNVYARDQALITARKTGSGSPSGAVAGTAGSAGVLATEYWDYTNRILYICTLTGAAATAQWTAINASAATAAYFAPQGRLTLTSGAPVMSADVSAGVVVLYEPYVGNLIPIYNGTTMVPTTFSALQLSLHSSHATNTIYDVFVFSNNGVVTIATGPAWSTSTAGAGARGTGAGTTQLSRVGGLWTNAVQITGRSGSITYTIGANLATYVGSIYIDGSAGQISAHLSYGQNRKFGVWNAYNRKRIVMLAGDSTASWTNNTNTVRQSNGATGNKLTVFCGLPEEHVDITFTQATGQSTGAVDRPSHAIGWNSTTTVSGTRAGGYDAGNGGSKISTTATYSPAPFIGINNVNALENGASTGGTFYGTETDMVLKAIYQG
jgi:hypothetical protein